MKEEEAVKELSYIADDMPSMECTDWKEAIVIAIDIIHKYQKIKQIIRRYDVTWEFHHMKPTIDEIREVIEK